MARIFYSLSGEGRGHATRVRALVENLRVQHEVSLFTYGDAYALLAPHYRRSSVRVHPIRGMRFRYRAGRVDLLRTAAAGASFLRRGLPEMVDHLSALLRRERPDLVITDFEPALPRAASRCGVPFVSLTHQHFLVVNDLSSLPARLRLWGDLMGLVVRGYYRGQARTIVSSFYAPPLKPSWRARADQVGVLIRPEILLAQPHRSGYLVAYLRKFAPDSALEALGACGLPVRVYGLGERPPVGGATFHPVSQRAFLDDLAGSEALVCTAGNQLVGEALYLEKPVLALPEPGNREQEINAHFVAAAGVGRQLPMDNLTAASLRGFLDALEGYRDAIVPEAANGTAKALRALEPYLA